MFRCYNRTACLYSGFSNGCLTRSGGDRKYDLLGFGYDITGKYFTNTSAKAQVIDPVAVSYTHLIQTGEIRIEFPGGIIAHFSGMAESQAAMRLQS